MSFTLDSSSFSNTAKSCKIKIEYSYFEYTRKHIEKIKQNGDPKGQEKAIHGICNPYGLDQHFHWLILKRWNPRVLLNLPQKTRGLKTGERRLQIGPNVFRMDWSPSFSYCYLESCTKNNTSSITTLPPCRSGGEGHVQNLDPGPWTTSWARSMDYPMDQVHGPPTVVDHLKVLKELRLYTPLHLSATMSWKNMFKLAINPCMLALSSLKVLSNIWHRQSGSVRAINNFFAQFKMESASTSSI